MNIFIYISIICLYCTVAITASAASAKYTCEGNCKDGRGIIYFDGKKVYEGQFQYEKYNGQGIEYRGDGNKLYDGEWKNDRKDGWGISFAPDGSRYEGQFKDDAKNGLWSIFGPDGTKQYEGLWKDGLCEYIGQTKNGKKDGKGTLYGSDGAKLYDGEWKDDRKSGQGILYSHDGSKYEGQFKDDKKNGTGTLYVPAVESKSLFSSLIGSDEKKEMPLVKLYEGQWKDDIKVQGIMYSQDGTRYEGQFKDDKKNGKGAYYVSDIRSAKNPIAHTFDIILVPEAKKDKKTSDPIAAAKLYEGDWLDDRLAGQGTYYYPDGKKLCEGEWMDDKLNGQATLYYPNGKKCTKASGKAAS